MAATGSVLQQGIFERADWETLQALDLLSRRCDKAGGRRSWHNMALWNTPKLSGRKEVDAAFTGRNASRLPTGGRTAQNAGRLSVESSIAGNLNTDMGNGIANR